MSSHWQFKKAVKLREKYPLQSGAYKLREAVDMLIRFEDEIQTLAHCREQKRPMVGRCTNGDQAKWLKDLPAKTIPYYLGYYLLPAIKALDGDGVLRQTINEFLPFFEQEITNLLDRCDGAYNMIKNRIGHEYEQWNDNESVLIPLLDTSLWLVELALDMLPPPTIKQNSSNLTEVSV
jgi:hypothetical protein